MPLTRYTRRNSSLADSGEYRVMITRYVEELSAITCLSQSIPLATRSAFEMLIALHSKPIVETHECQYRRRIYVL